jgi:hypothetical protein
MSWEIENPMVTSTIDLRSGNDYFADVEESEEREEMEAECACGCGYLIEFYDAGSYVESELCEDEFIINDPDHLKKYLKNNNVDAELVASKAS